MSGIFPDRLPTTGFAVPEADQPGFADFVRFAGRSADRALEFHRDLAGAAADAVLYDWLDVENERRPAIQELIGAAFGAGRYVENFNAARAAEAEAYDRRINTVRAATGAELANPLGRGARTREEWQRLNVEFGGDGYAWEREKKRAFDAELRALAEKFPMARGQILGAGPMEEQALEITRQAQRRFEQAMLDPALAGSFMTRVGASVAGYLGAGVYDPFQVVTAFAGAGPSTARTVTARLVQVVATEAAMNAGVEAAMRERARSLRLEAGLALPTPGEDLVQVGIAALFGGIVGGAAQGAREYARAMEAALDRRLTAEGVAALERAFDGWSAPGDAAILKNELAPALGRPLTADEDAALSRAIEEDSLDDDYLRSIAAGAGVEDPDQVAALAAAAARYAEDPDNHLPPELVADQMRLPQDELRFMTADDYIDAYDLGEQVDPVADAVDGLVDRLDEIEEAVQALPERRVPQEDGLSFPDEQHRQLYAMGRALATAGDGPQALDAVDRDTIQQLYAHFRGFVVEDPVENIVFRKPSDVRKLAIAYYQDIADTYEPGARVHDMIADDEARAAYLRRQLTEEVTAALRERPPSIVRETPPPPQLEPLIRPETVVEPGTPEAFEAALRASGLTPAPRLATGDTASAPEPAARAAAAPGEYGFRVADEATTSSPWELIPIVDRDGTSRFGTANDAFEAADETDDFADLLEACQV